MTMEMIAFVLLSAGLLGTSAAVLIAKNPIHSALYLVLSFFSLAGLYLLLNANFVAIIQVLVYAGAIMVLFLFVIMLLNLSDRELGDSRWNLHKVLGTLAGVGLLGVLLWAITGAEDRYLNDITFMRAQAVKTLARRVAMPSELPNSPWQGLKADADVAFYKDLRAWKRLSDAASAQTPSAMCALAMPELEAELRDQCTNQESNLVRIGEQCRHLRGMVMVWRAQGCEGVLSGAGEGALKGEVERVLGTQRLAGVGEQVETLREMTAAQSGALEQLPVGEVAEFYLNLIELRTLSAEKLRFEHGQGSKQAEACERLAKVLPFVDQGRCVLLGAGAQQHVDACFALEESRPLGAEFCDAVAKSPKARMELDSLCSAGLLLGRDAAAACWGLPPHAMEVQKDVTLYRMRCLEAVSQLNALEVPRCGALRGAFMAEVVAAAEAASEGFDARLAKVEAALDASPVPAQWRGAEAYRRPATGLSRYEQAVVDAVGVFAARRVNAAVDEEVDPERLRLEGQEWADQARDGKEAQQGVFALAQRRYERVMKAHGEPQRLKERFEAAEAVYLADVKRVVEGLRGGKPGQVMSLIRRRLEEEGGALDAGARAHVSEVLRALASPQGGEVVVRNPVVLDEDDFGSIRAVGRELFTKLLLPFEVTSVLLLAAMMGAVVIAKRRSS
jgi:NADH:ubiquinone oxidoreductase subunit 6 (subunit J)